jgi:probable F420-dependent oxidoreductase
MSIAFSPVEHYVPLARAADESGWGYVAIADHVANPEHLESKYPYTGDGTRRWEPFTPWPDPWVMVGTMAAVTQRVRFLTTVYVLPMRPPLQVAKTVGTAAAVSGGRVTLGAGMGWMEEEFTLLEQPFRQRGRRADEMIDVIRKVWQGGWVEHHGEFYDFDKLEVSPAPPGPVPIWIGGLSEPALKRAARNDGWISDLMSTDDIVRSIATVERHRADGGRSGTEFAYCVSSKEAADLDGYKRLRDAGVTHLLTWPWVFYSGFTDDLQQRVDGIHRFADDIIAKL